MARIYTQHDRDKEFINTKEQNIKSIFEMFGVTESMLIDEDPIQEAEVVESKPLEEERKPNRYISKKSITVKDEMLGQVEIPANWPLERIIDDPQYFSDGFNLIDERHLIARPGLFEPRYDDKKIE